MRRFMAFMLAAVIMGSLAACGGSSGGTPVATPAPTAVAPAATDAPSTPDTPADIVAEPAGYIKDLGGREIRVMAWWNYYETVTDSPEPDPEISDNYVTDMMFWENLQRIKDEYNCKIVSIPIDTEEVMPTLTTSVLAGSPAADLYMLCDAWALSAVLGDCLLSLDSYIPADADIFNEQSRVIPVMELNDKYWTMKENTPMDTGYFIGVNMDIIRAIGAEDPVELYKNGEWTFEKFREICKLATRDTTGDNIIDQYGISGVPGDILVHLIAANDGILVNEDDMSYGLNDPKTITALNLAYDIFNTDKTYYFDESTGGEFDDWDRDFYSFMDGRSAFFVCAIWGLDGDITFDYRTVPFPTGPDNKKGYSHFNGIRESLGVPRGTQNPGDVYTIFEQIQQWYGDDPELATSGLVDWMYSCFLTEEDAIRGIDICNETGKFDIGMVVDTYEWFGGGMARSFYYGEATVAQAVEQQRQESQSLLDEMFSGQ